MLIRIAHEFHDAFFTRQTPGESGEWGEITFTEEKVEKCDILLCLTYPQTDIAVRCREAWLLSLEPPAQMRRWERKSYKYFDRVLTTWRDLPDRCQPCVNWFPNRTYDEFTALEQPPKSKSLSWVTSSNSDLYGHKLRMKLLNHLREKNTDFDLFGRGFSSIPDKADGLIPYRYSLAIENFRIADYWTEKIADCFLCWTVPFYWGAPNIDKYFPKGSYIDIDPKRPAWSLGKINETLSSNYAEENAELIREARELVLNKYQLFPYMSEKVREHPLKPLKKDIFIPKCNHPRENGGLEKLRYKFDYFLSKHFNM